MSPRCVHMVCVGASQIFWGLSQSWGLGQGSVKEPSERGSGGGVKSWSLAIPLRVTGRERPSSPGKEHACTLSQSPGAPLSPPAPGQATSFLGSLRATGGNPNSGLFPGDSPAPLLAPGCQGHLLPFLFSKAACQPPVALWPPVAGRKLRGPGSARLGRGSRWQGGIGPAPASSSPAQGPSAPAN